MRQARGIGTAAVVMLLLSGCAGVSDKDEEAAPAPSSPSEAGTLSSFGSIDEAYDAVAGVLDCDTGTAAEPVTVQIDGYLPEYRMCTDTVEVVRYENEADRTKASDLLNSAGNPLPYFAEGGNWHVLVLPDREGVLPASEEISALAEQLDGRYVAAAAAG